MPRGGCGAGEGPRPRGAQHAPAPGPPSLARRGEYPRSQQGSPDGGRRGEMTPFRGPGPPRAGPRGLCCDPDPKPAAPPGPPRPAPRVARPPLAASPPIRPGGRRCTYTGHHDCARDPEAGSRCPFVNLKFKCLPAVGYQVTDSAGEHRGRWQVAVLRASLAKLNQAAVSGLSNAEVDPGAFAQSQAGAADAAASPLPEGPEPDVDPGPTPSNKGDTIC